MPDLDTGTDFVGDDDAIAAEVNARFDAIEAWANASIASVIADSGTAGRVLIVNGGGVPALQAVTGDVTFTSGGATAIGTDKVEKDNIADNSVGADEQESLPGVRVRRTGAQAIPNSTLTTLEWATADVAVDFESGGSGFHDGSTNTSRITFPKTGVYVVSASLSWEQDDGGRREFQLTDSSGVILAGEIETNPPLTVSVKQNLSLVQKFTANDYIEAKVYQSSGGSLFAQANPGSSIAAHWLGKG